MLICGLMHALSCILRKMKGRRCQSAILEFALFVLFPLCTVYFLEAMIGLGKLLPARSAFLKGLEALNV